MDCTYLVHSQQIDVVVDDAWCAALLVERGRDVLWRACVCQCGSPGARVAALTVVVSCGWRLRL